MFLFFYVYILSLRGRYKKGKTIRYAEAKKNHTLASENGSEDCRNDSRKSFFYSSGRKILPARFENNIFRYICASFCKVRSVGRRMILRKVLLKLSSIDRFSQNLLVVKIVDDSTCIGCLYCSVRRLYSNAVWGYCFIYY